MTVGTLLCFLPCSASKRPLGNISTGASASFSPGDHSLINIDNGREAMRHTIRAQSQPTPALEMYTGHLYRTPGLKPLARAMVDMGELHLFILSGGYGVVHASEMIRDYEAPLADETASLWRQHGLVEAIAGICVDLKPSEIYGFFAGQPYWSGMGGKYRYFFTEGIGRAIESGLNPTHAGCFHRLSGMGAASILQSLGQVYMDVLVSDTRGAIREKAQARGVKCGEVTIGYHDLLKNRPVPRVQSEPSVRVESDRRTAAKPHADDFQRELDRMLLAAGGGSVEITAGELHRRVGGYPGPNHQMPTCCRVMYRNVQGQDQIIARPPKGMGASLRIEYRRCRKVPADLTACSVPEERHSARQDSRELLLSQRAAVAQTLHNVFWNGDGVFGRKADDMPEVKHLRQVESYARVNVLTVTAVMDYRTDAEALWKAAAATYLDPETRWVFDMEKVASEPVTRLTMALEKHGFIGTSSAKNPGYVHRVCSTFARKYGGTPHGLLARYDHNAALLYSQRRSLGDLPFLRGNKIFPFWLRILKDVAKLDLVDIHRVPIPVDIHTARSTYRVVYRKPDRPDVAGCSEEITRDWFDICDSVANSNVYPLALDQALWLLSRNGCSHTDDAGCCTLLEECVVGVHCTFSDAPRCSGS